MNVSILILSDITSTSEVTTIEAVTEIELESSFIKIEDSAFVGDELRPYFVGNDRNSISGNRELDFDISEDDEVQDSRFACVQNQSMPDFLKESIQEYDDLNLVKPDYKEDVVIWDSFRMDRYDTINNNNLVLSNNNFFGKEFPEDVNSFVYEYKAHDYTPEHSVFVVQLQPILEWNKIFTPCYDEGVAFQDIVNVPFGGALDFNEFPRISSDYLTPDNVSSPNDSNKFRLDFSDQKNSFFSQNLLSPVSAKELSCPEQFQGSLQNLSMLSEFSLKTNVFYTNEDKDGSEIVIHHDIDDNEVHTDASSFVNEHSLKDFMETNLMSEFSESSTQFPDICHVNMSTNVHNLNKFDEISDVVVTSLPYFDSTNCLDNCAPQQLQQLRSSPADLVSEHNSDETKQIIYMSEHCEQHQLDLVNDSRSAIFKNSALELIDSVPGFGCHPCIHDGICYVSNNCCDSGLAVSDNIGNPSSVGNPTALETLSGHESDDLCKLTAGVFEHPAPEKSFIDRPKSADSWFSNSSKQTDNNLYLSRSVCYVQYEKMMQHTDTQQNTSANDTCSCHPSTCSSSLDANSSEDACLQRKVIGGNNKITDLLRKNVDSSMRSNASAVVVSRYTLENKEGVISEDSSCVNQDSITSVSDMGQDESKEAGNADDPAAKVNTNGNRACDDVKTSGACRDASNEAVPLEMESVSAASAGITSKNKSKIKMDKKVSDAKTLNPYGVVSNVDNFEAACKTPQEETMFDAQTSVCCKRIQGYR